MLTTRQEIDGLGDPIGLGFGLQLATSPQDADAELFRVAPRRGEEFAYRMEGFNDKSLQLVESPDDVSASESLAFNRTDFRGGAGLLRQSDQREERQNRYKDGRNIYVDLDNGYVRPTRAPGLISDLLGGYVPDFYLASRNVPPPGVADVADGQVVVYVSDPNSVRYVDTRNGVGVSPQYVGGAPGATVNQIYDVTYDPFNWDFGQNRPYVWVGCEGSIGVYDFTTGWTEIATVGRNIDAIWYRRGQIWTVEVDTVSNVAELCLYNDVALFTDRVVIDTVLPNVEPFAPLGQPVAAYRFTDIGIGHFLTGPYHGRFYEQDADLNWQLKSVVTIPHSRVYDIVAWGDRYVVQASAYGRTEFYLATFENGSLANLAKLHEREGYPVGLVSQPDGVFGAIYNPDETEVGAPNIWTIRIDPDNGAWHPYHERSDVSGGGGPATRSNPQLVSGAVPAAQANGGTTQLRAVMVDRRQTETLGTPLSTDIWISDYWNFGITNAYIDMAVVDMNSFTKKRFVAAEFEYGTLDEDETNSPVPMHVQWRVADNAASGTLPPWVVLPPTSGSLPVKDEHRIDALDAYGLSGREIDVRLVWPAVDIGDQSFPWLKRIRIEGVVEVRERVYDVPILISDRVERPGRAPMHMPGLGAATRTRLRELERKQLLITLLGLETTMVGYIELGASASDESFADGEPFQVQVVRLKMTETWRGGTSTVWG